MPDPIHAVMPLKNRDISVASDALPRNILSVGYFMGIAPTGVKPVVVVPLEQG